MASAIVIGAGLAGVTTAFYLQRAGVDVQVIDAEASAGNGASFANGGLLTPSMSDPWNTPGVWRDLLRYLGDENAPMLLRLRALPSLLVWGLQFLAASRRHVFEKTVARNVRLAMYSLECLAALRTQLLLDYDAASRGTVKIYRDEKSLQDGADKARSLRDFGVEFQQYSGHDISSLEPSLASIQSELAGALHFPNDESGDAHKFTHEIVRHAEQLGASFRWNAEVRSIERVGSNVSGVTLRNGEYIAANTVVLASGAQSPFLARTARTQLSIRPVKGYSLSFRMDAIPEAERLMLPIIDDDLHAAVVPLGDVLRVAGTAEFAGFDPTLTAARTDNLRHILRSILPRHAKYLADTHASAWAGFRPVHALGSPVIGRTAVDGVYINSGHGPLGWTMAAGSAQALAELITSGRSDFNLDDYSINRSQR